MNVHSEIIHHSQKMERKQPKYLPADEWVNKIGYMYIVKHYLAIKRNELLIDGI